MMQQKKFFISTICLMQRLFEWKGRSMMKRVVGVLIVFALLINVLPAAAHHESGEQQYTVENESHSADQDSQADNGKSVQKKRCCNKDEN